MSVLKFRWASRKCDSIHPGNLERLSWRLYLINYQWGGIKQPKNISFWKWQVILSSYNIFRYYLTAPSRMRVPTKRQFHNWLRCCYSKWRGSSLVYKNTQNNPYYYTMTDVSIVLIATEMSGNLKLTCIWYKYLLRIPKNVFFNLLSRLPTL